MSVLVCNTNQYECKEKYEDIPRRNKVFYAIFGFITETNNMEYFYIKYVEDLFNSYEKQVIFNKEHF